MQVLDDNWLLVATIFTRSPSHPVSAALTGQPASLLTWAGVWTLVTTAHQRSQPELGSHTGASRDHVTCDLSWYHYMGNMDYSPPKLLSSSLIAHHKPSLLSISFSDNIPVPRVCNMTSDARVGYQSAPQFQDVKFDRQVIMTGVWTLGTRKSRVILIRCHYHI